MDRRETEWQLFRALLDDSHDSIVIVDAAGVIQYWSHSATRLLGHTRDEAVGQPLEQLGALVLPESAWSSDDTSHSEGDPAPRVLECEGIQKSGQRISLALTRTSVTIDGQQWTVAIIRNDSARKQREADLQRQANTDPLSGLANRAAFQQHLEANLSAPIALTIIDLDRFKQVNDQWGHLAGDAAIERVAELIRTHFESAICAARLGGDEFGILLRAASDADIRPPLEAFRVAVAAEEEPGGEGGVGGMTVSMGVTRRREGDTPRSLLARADQFLFDAKSAGRNQIVSDGPGPTPNSRP